MQTKLLALATKLAELTTTYNIKCYHYEAPEKENPPYMVWAEDDRIDLIADNSHTEKGVQGTIDYYTKTEFDTNVDTIETVIDGTGMSWYLNSIQYETDTGLIHYEWVWTIG